MSFNNNLINYRSYLRNTLFSSIGFKKEIIDSILGRDETFYYFRRSITHSLYDPNNNYGSLKIAGEGIFKMNFMYYIFNKFPYVTESILTRVNAYFRSKNILAKIEEELFQLDNYIILREGQKLDNEIRRDVLESILFSIVLTTNIMFPKNKHLGVSLAQHVIIWIYDRFNIDVNRSYLYVDNVTKLKEVKDFRNMGKMKYLSKQIIEEDEEGGRFKNYIVSVLFDDDTKIIGSSGISPDKTTAKNNAAKEALDYIRKDDRTRIKYEDIGILRAKNFSDQVPELYGEFQKVLNEQGYDISTIQVKKLRDEDNKDIVILRITARALGSEIETNIKEDSGTKNPDISTFKYDLQLFISILERHIAETGEMGSGKYSRIEYTDEVADFMSFHFGDLAYPPIIETEREDVPIIIVQDRELMKEYKDYLINKLFPSIGIDKDVIKILVEKDTSFEVFKTAITHRLYDPVNNYETLETVGDAVLKSSFIQYLIKNFPDLTNEAISKINWHFTQKKSLSKYTVNILKIDRFIRLKEGQILSIGTKEDVFESFIGAIADRGNIEFSKYGYVGFAIAQKVVNWVYDQLNIDVSNINSYEIPKTKLKNLFDFLGWGEVYYKEFKTKNGEFGMKAMRKTEEGKDTVANIKTTEVIGTKILENNVAVKAIKDIETNQGIYYGDLEIHRHKKYISENNVDIYINFVKEVRKRGLDPNLVKVDKNVKSVPNITIMQLSILDLYKSYGTFLSKSEGSRGTLDSEIFKQAMQVYIEEGKYKSFGVKDGPKLKKVMVNYIKKEYNIKI